MDSNLAPDIDAFYATLREHFGREGDTEGDADDEEREPREYEEVLPPRRPMAVKSPPAKAAPVGSSAAAPPAKKAPPKRSPFAGYQELSL